MSLEDYYILECDIRPTILGEALRIQIHRWDMAAMGWPELCAVFNEAYPGRWACQMFPPALEVIDQANKYHLFVFEEYPHGLDLGAPQPRGSRHPER